MKSTDKEILEIIEEWNSRPTGDNYYVQYGECVDLIAIIREKLKAKPQPKCKYEKVTDSIFDLKDELESRVLHTKSGGSYHKIPSEEALIDALSSNYIVYRKVEADPVEELAKKLCETECGVNSYAYEWGGLGSDGKDGYKAMAQYVIDHKEEL